MIASLPRLHAVTDDRVVGEGIERLVARADVMARAAGPHLAVHLRARVLGGAAFLRVARELLRVLEPHGSWLVVNDRADVARAAPTRVVVTGRGGLVPADVRRVAPEALVGRSVHDEVEVAGALAEGADFLVAGAVWATPTHAAEPLGGLALVRAAARTGRPVVAIGGVTPANAAEAMAAGASAVAAIRALWDAPDPAEAARSFLPAGVTAGVSAGVSAASLAVTINGEPRTVAPGSLASLLGQLGLDPRAVVVEHNRRIVHRDTLGATDLAAGDSIELVHFVGGG